MRLSTYLSRLTKPELEELREQMNLSDDEVEVFEHLAKGRSNLFVAEKCGISISTLDTRIKVMKCKIIRLRGEING